MTSDLPDADRLREERQRVGRSIQNCRVDHGLTQEQVILAIPMNRAFYQKIESGIANPSLNTLLKIARAIGVHISELLADEAPAAGPGC
ncbi:helix-turn-helix transcriptional regulator [Streptomyces sp. NPDC005732]|uniref:helix-turn-helix domain-containing protein n=1 Tax=Streptomyces sp. NPDC005732 TaxID=3157057 RepID=UPI0033F4C451